MHAYPHALPAQVGCEFVGPARQTIPHPLQFCGSFVVLTDVVPLHRVGVPPEQPLTHPVPSQTGVLPVQLTLQPPQLGDWVMSVSQPSSGFEEQWADTPRLGNGPLGQRPPQTVASMLRPDKESLHLADRLVRRTHCDAACGSIGVRCQEEATTGRGIATGKIGQLVGESLKAKVHAKPRRILLEEAAYGGDLFSRDCLAYLHGA